MLVTIQLLLVDVALGLLFVGGLGLLVGMGLGVGGLGIGLESLGTWDGLHHSILLKVLLHLVLDVSFRLLLRVVRVTWNRKVNG